MSRRSFRADYLSVSPELRPFYEYNPIEPDWAQILADRSAYPVHRRQLADLLQAQNRLLPNNEATMANIRLLRKENTFSVTTGQQPALFGGPLYVIYKAIGAIQLCQKLKRQFPSLNFVPVFWMASEDHDFEEVNHTFFNYHATEKYKGRIVGAVGRHSIDETIRNLACPLPEIREFNAEGSTWSEAFRQTLHFWLGKYGLIVLDPDDSRLKKVFAPIAKRELMERASFALLEQTSEQLKTAGFHRQLQGREINLFYLTNAGRKRIEFENNRLFIHESGISFNQEEILVELETHPERFSPNAALRPVYQETILPNLAYVGGWGELAYWFQLKDIFKHYGAFYPALLPRPSALLVSQKQADEWIKSGLDLADIQLPDHQFRRKLAETLWDKSALSPEIEAIKSAYNLLAEKTAQFSAGQERNVRGQMTKADKFLNDLDRRISRDVLRSHPSIFHPMQRLKNSVQPDGEMQERSLNAQAVSGENAQLFMDQLFSEIEKNTLGETRLIVI